jgi:RHS repeat-associated protein
MSLAESGTETDYLFTGKELDNGTGLSYSINRYLDQRIGRWWVPDPAGQYWSPYVYCGNNPVNRIDPDGKEDGEDDEIDILMQEQNIYGDATKDIVQAAKELPKTIIEEVDNAVESSIELTSGLSDATSNVATGGAVTGTLVATTGLVLTAAGVPAGPAITATGLNVTKDALTVGLVSDVTSLAAKGTNAMLYNGSKNKFNNQLVKTGVNLSTTLLFKLKPVSVVARTTSKMQGPMFRSTTSGRFVSNTFGSTVSVATDATKVLIVLEF